ncbi:MAG: Ribonuclease P protein component 3 [Candidatus Bathyarchaeota archaeon B24]|nr:MAG: Ribonuclease P protein component 3 [Candidatus Bathyarchaeota archaeon B24]
MLEIAEELGFSTVALTVQDVRASPPEVISPNGLQVVWRIDLKPEEAQPSLLARLRRRYTVIAASCSSRREFRRALRTRVDLVFQDRPFAMNLSDARVLSLSGKFFELNLKPLMHIEGVEMARLLRHLRRSVRLLRKLDIPVVVSSWASEPHELTAPLELPQHLALVDVNPHECYGWVSEKPAKLLEVCESRRIGLPEGVRILEV